MPSIEYRIEKDLLGERKIPNDAYYGINTIRAVENFSISGKTVNKEIIKALSIVKKAAAITNKKLKNISDEIADLIIRVCDELLSGEHSNQFIVDAYQGGAGTSTNMNVNEVIANRAIEINGEQKGDNALIHPLHHVNCCQSTNDVYLTAVRIAAIKQLRKLSDAFASLQVALQEKENEFADIIKLGRTELMDAVPMMAGQGFGAYARAISRDRWRLYKVEERLREINIGGTAIGTGINAPIAYAFMVTEKLQDLTGYGLAKSEYPMDTTQNMDVFVEVSGLVKAAATNLMKISNDLRFLASGPRGGIGEVILPEIQAGSSIMPGKINPVILEMVGQISIKVNANDSTITLAAMNGQLELNCFAPLIAESLLESLELMTNAVDLLEEKCIKGIKVDKKKCLVNLEKSQALVTALVHHIGYDKASEISKIAISENKTIKQVLMDKKLMDEKKIDEILNPYQVTKPGIPGI